MIAVIPAIKIRFRIDVNKSIGRIGFKLFAISLNGILERAKETIQKTAPVIMLTKTFPAKSITIYASAITSLNRGSSL